MIPHATLAALRNMLSREARLVFAKTLGLTLLVLGACWFGLKTLFDGTVMPWVDAGLAALPGWAGVLEPAASVLAGAILAVGLALLLAPVTALVAGLFLDDVAEVIEKGDYPGETPGRALPALAALGLSVKFLGVVVLGNLLALVLLLVPGVNLVAFLLVNGYLLGREFFEFAAMRFRRPAEARALRRAHAGTVLLGGLVIAA